MAVLGRLLISSAERLDLPDLLSIDSYSAGDWKYFLKGIIGDDKPFILKGFDVIDPQSSIGKASCSIRVADSAVFYPGSGAGSFYHGLEEGNVNALPLVPELRKNATNFVYATFSTFNTSADTRAFWDPDKDGGDGGEFTQDVNTESVLKVEINVSTGSFPANTIPIAKIALDGTGIISITDCRDLLYRLGSGGIDPDPFANYSFRSLPDSSYKRTEPSITMSAGGDNPFQGGDKNIQSLKEWMDLVMTKFKELSGTVYWYEDLSTYSLISGFIDALSTTFKSKGKWQHSSSTPGEVTWTEDIQIKITQDTRDYIVRAGVKTLADEQVMYIDLQRNLPINGSDAPVEWRTNQVFVDTVGGAVGLFSDLVQGDWIKKTKDPNNYFRRVEQFYTNTGMGGVASTPANAKSIRLSGPYLGTSEVEKARRDQGVYENADVIVSDRDQNALVTAGGNFHWLAIRSDTIEKIDAISSVTLTGTLSEPDGQTAKVVSVAHNMKDGDRITVTQPAAQAGTYEIEVEDVDTFYIETIDLTEGAFEAFYGLSTTTTRDNGYGLLLESDNHSFQSGDTIIVAGTVGYDDAYVVNRRSATQFQFAFGSVVGAEVVGTATLARVNVRAEQGLIKLIQGSSADIGDPSTENMKKFMGMTSNAQVHPDYHIAPDYNTLDGMVNYNSLASDNITDRLSKLTAMMADKSQDRNLSYAASSSLTTVTNTTNGIAQEITFNAPGSTLVVVTPGSTGNATIALPSSAPGISLEANQIAYVVIDRNKASTPSIVITDIAKMPISENMVMVALRLSGTDIYIWEGSYVPAGSIPYPGALGNVIRQNQMLKLVDGGIWSWDLVTETISWSEDAFIQVPGLANSANQIVAGSAVASDGQVLYVDINRTSPGGALTVSVADNSTLPLTTDRFIIARIGAADAIVGTHSMRLSHGDPKSLYGENNKRNTVRLLDDVSTSLPSGPGVTIDGIALADSDKVLFTNLTTASDRGIYVAATTATSATWIRLNAFNGGDLPYIGALVSVQEGGSFLHAVHEWDGISWKREDNADVTLEATGFPNRTDSTIAFDDGTRTFTISPVVDHFDYYSRGVRYRKTAAQTVVIPDVEGLHYVYFEGPTLIQGSGFSADIINKFAYVATVYWDAANASGIMVGDERHGLSLDWATHQYLHTVNGAQIDNGFAAGDFTIIGDGSADTDAQLSIANGRLFDEDVIVDISNSAAPSGLFEQILDPIAEIPVFYRDGANGFWRKNAALAYPLMPGAGGTAAAQVVDLTFSGRPNASDYFRISSANDEHKYTIWYTYNGAGVAPIEVDRTTIEVALISGDNDQTSAAKTQAVLDTLSGISAIVSTNVITVTNDLVGVTTAPTSIVGVRISVNVTTSGSEGPLLKHNLYSGGSWSQPNSDGNNYVAMWIFATNNINEPIIALLGQREDDSLSDAQANNTYESLSFGDMPSAEMKVLYRLIYQARSSYANTVSASLRDVRDLRRAVDTSIGAYSASDHGLLTGLTDQDHPASAIYTNTTNFNNILNAADDDVQKALDSLDNKAMSVADANQDRSIKMVEGRVWSWDSSSRTLSWSTAAYMQVPGISRARNSIAAGSVVLPSYYGVAYVDINRTEGAPATLTVGTANVQNMPLNNNRVIFARVVDNNNGVIVGTTDGMLLKDGELLELDGALAEINRYHSQLKLIKEPGYTDRLRIYQSDITLLNNDILSQELNETLLAPTYAVIDFAAGVVSRSPLPNENFTPYTIPNGHYFWYSIGLTSDNITADNRTGVTVQVTPASASSVSSSTGPYPNLIGDKKLGAVQIHNVGGILTVNKIIRLGAGSGGGSNSAVEVSLNDAQLVPADVDRLKVDSARNRAFVVDYSIVRALGDPEELTSQGTLRAIYKTIGGWQLAGETYVGDDVGTTFSIDASTGQVQYTTTATSSSTPLLVAVANSGTDRVMHSSDGINWTSATAAQSNFWEDMTYSPSLGRFVAISSGGTSKVMYSSDGITWTSATSANANTWKAVTWSPGLNLFVAVASQSSYSPNKVMYSSDGITWTDTPASGVYFWSAITWSPSLGLFCAVAQGGGSGTPNAMTSSDGITWNNATISAAGEWNGVTWSPSLGLFCAVAISGPNQVMHSPDGINWTYASAAAFGGWKAIAWSPSLNLFVAVSDSGTFKVMYSSDGITWTGKAAIANNWRSVIWSPSLNLFVAVSETGSNYVMHSPDGVTWTGETATGSGWQSVIEGAQQIPGTAGTMKYKINKL